MQEAYRVVPKVRMKIHIQSHRALYVPGTMLPLMASQTPRGQCRLLRSPLTFPNNGNIFYKVRYMNYL